MHLHVSSYHFKHCDIHGKVWLFKFAESSRGHFISPTALLSLNVAVSSTAVIYANRQDPHPLKPAGKGWRSGAEPFGREQFSLRTWLKRHFSLNQSIWIKNQLGWFSFIIVVNTVWCQWLFQSQGLWGLQVCKYGSQQFTSNWDRIHSIVDSQTAQGSQYGCKVIMSVKILEQPHCCWPSCRWYRDFWEMLNSSLTWKRWRNKGLSRSGWGRIDCKLEFVLRWFFKKEKNIFFLTWLG